MPTPYKGLGGRLLWGTLLTVFVLPSALTIFLLWRQYQLEGEAARSADETLQFFRSSLAAEIEAAMHGGPGEGIHATLKRAAEYRFVSSISLIDGNGLVVATANRTAQPSFMEYELYRAALHSAQEVMHHAATPDALVYRVAIPLVNKPGCQRCHGTAQAVNGVLAAELRLNVRAGFRSRLAAMLGLLFLAGAAATAIAYSGLRRNVLSPIRRLVEAARQVARGDLSPRLQAPRWGELRELTEGFNRMVGDLEAHVAALERTTQEREESKRMAEIGEMAAQVAHQLRNPLNAIEGAAYYLRSLHPDEPEVIEYAGLIGEQVARLNALTAELLRAARPSAVLEREAVDVNQLVRTTAERLRGQRAGKTVEIEYRLADGLAPILLDPRQLAAALENLLENAWDAIDGPGRITLETAEERLDDRNPSLRLVVADTGRGIAPEHHAKLFTPFHTTKPGGTGLGLVVVKRIIAAHGGKIDVTSRLGEGTTVTIRVPIQR